MNKFIVFALIACSAALVVARPPGDLTQVDGMSDEKSELALNPPDEEEAEQLKGTNLEGFTDFCLQTRDTVLGDLKNRGNAYTSMMFSSLFKSIGDVTQKSIDAQTKASDSLTKQLANPDAAIDTTGQTEVDHIIADSQKSIQEAKNQPQGFFAAVVGGLKSFGAAGYEQTVQKLQALREEIGTKLVGNNLVKFCEELSKYEEQAIQIFNEAKEGLVAENAEQYKNVKYSDVAPKCVTAGRLTRAEGFCKFVLTAKDPLSKALNVKLPGTNAEQ